MTRSSVLLAACVAFRLVPLATAEEPGGAAAPDLTALLPQGALAYLELRRPGDHLARLVEAAGLTRRGEKQPFYVSPRLLQSLKSVAGAALAVVDVDPQRGEPRGVLVVDPGQADLVYGLVETALSGGAAAGEIRAAEAVEGALAYDTPVGVVALTERLVVLGSSRELVAAALARLKGGRDGAAPVDPGLVEARAQGGDSFLSLHVDLRTALERVKTEAFRGGEPPEEYRIAQAIADVESLRWASLRLGVGDAGLAAELRLRLDDDNHAFAYHLLRTPRVSEAALRAVPAGAAAFIAFALGEGGEKPAAGTPAGEPGPITGLDLGRELFANVRDVAAFVLPWKEAPAGKEPPIPDAAIVLTVRDPARSEALWRQLLSIAAVVAGAQIEPVRKETLGGRTVHVFALEKSLELRFVSLPDRVVAATSAAAVEAAIAAAAGGDSAASDAELQRAVARAGARPSKLAVLHLGRLWQLVKPFADVDGDEEQAIEAATRDAAITIATEESAASFRLSLTASVPRLDAVLEKLLGQQAVSAGTSPAPSERLAGF